MAQRLTGTRLQQRNRRILLRDKGICQLCGQPVRLDVNWRHPLAPQVDHITPISQGGTETDTAVQLTHRHCNRTKSDTIPTTPSRDW
jgi:5-methylcytosine-specific restriction endonuclease McrA